MFGRTGRAVSEIGFGAWAVGASWGQVDDTAAKQALHAALDSGVTFIDTAGVYGDGHSERLIADVLKERGGERPYVATKAGRRLPKQAAEGYSFDNLSGWIERSLRNLDVDTLDLVQLHCPPTDVYDHPAVVEALDTLKAQGKIRDYGISVERIDEALKAIEFPGVVSVQIIFNIFRQRPLVGDDANFRWGGEFASVGKCPTETTAADRPKKAVLNGQTRSVSISALKAGGICRRLGW